MANWASIRLDLLIKQLLGECLDHLKILIRAFQFIPLYFAIICFLLCPRPLFGINLGLLSIIFSSEISVELCAFFSYLHGSLTDQNNTVVADKQLSNPLRISTSTSCFSCLSCYIPFVNYLSKKLDDGSHQNILST